MKSASSFTKTSAAILCAFSGMVTMLHAVDNGNPVSHESYKSDERLCYHGRCLGIVQSTHAMGLVRINVRADGLAPASVELDVQKPAIDEPQLP